MNQTLKFESLKKHSPLLFSSPLFVLTIDISRIISKNILSNDDSLVLTSITTYSRLLFLGQHSNTYHENLLKSSR